MTICIRCKKDSDYPFKNALHTYNLIGSDSIFIKAVANMYKEEQIFESSSKYICVLCLPKLLKTYPYLQPLITKKELKALQENVNQFHKDKRQRDLF